jgi:hypothetical protein
MPDRRVEKPPYLQMRKNSLRRLTGARFAPPNRFRRESDSIALQQFAVNQNIKYVLTR